MIKRFIKIGLILALALPILVEASTGLTIQPVKISHTLSKNEVANGSILLTNASDDQVRVMLKVEDFVPNAGGEGVKFVSRAPGLTTVRDWITLNNGGKEIFLQKNESKAIPYKIITPSDAEPGSHFGVAFFEATAIKDTGEQLKIGTQVGTLIFVTVPGNYLQKGNILDFSAPSFVQGLPVPFSINFENTGTVHFEPKGAIVIKNIFGKVVATVPVEGQVVLPTGTKDIQASFDGDGVLIGRYTADLSIRDGEGNILTAKSIAFYAFPIKYAVIIIILVIGIFYFLRFLKSKVNISISVNNKKE